MHAFWMIETAEYVFLYNRSHTVRILDVDTGQEIDMWSVYPNGRDGQGYATESEFETAVSEHITSWRIESDDLLTRAREIGESDYDGTDRENPLSGEFAEDRTPVSLMWEIGLTPEYVHTDYHREICDAYESGWMDAAGGDV